MRNFIFLALLGVILATVAIVVRSGMLKRSNPGKPINQTMRESMEKDELSDADAALIAKNYPGATKTESGLFYLVQTPGSGPVVPNGATVRAHFEARLLDGRVFDSSRSGQPLEFVLGRTDTVRGWTEGFSTMKKGERRTLILPFWLAYGIYGKGPVPPRATVVFDVELLDFR